MDYQVIVACDLDISDMCVWLYQFWFKQEDETCDNRNLWHHKPKVLRNFWLHICACWKCQDILQQMYCNQKFVSHLQFLLSQRSILIHLQHTSNSSRKLVIFRNALPQRCTFPGFEIAIRLTSSKEEGHAKVYRKTRTWRQRSILLVVFFMRLLEYRAKIQKRTWNTLHTYDHTRPQCQYAAPSGEKVWLQLNPNSISLHCVHKAHSLFLHS